MGASSLKTGNTRLKENLMNRIPYDPSEVNTTDTYPPFIPGFPGSKKFKTPVSPRENYEALYRHELPLWLPSGSDSSYLTPRFIADNVARAFALESDPMLAREPVPVKDIFGVEWIFVPAAGGSMVKPGDPILKDANDWPKAIHFPDVDSWDWEGSARANANYAGDRALTFGILNGIYERLISFMDFENAAVALIDEDQKDAIHSLFDKLATMYDRIITHAKKYFNPLIINFHDDWGSQRSPFFSLATVREMILPYLKRVGDSIHRNGMYFDMHSCGKNELLVPAYIEAGCDSWSGQPMNDKAMLYEKYGDKIILGIETDVELTMESSTEDYIQAAKRFVQKYGSNFAKKPVLCSAFAMNPAFSDTVYEESRKRWA
jgi:hypothetical protein